MQWRSAGTGLCSYRVTGVDGICAEHLTVESYTVFICQQSYLLLFGIPSLTHSFFPDLKPSFSANPSNCSPSFLLIKYLLRGFPGLFTVISEHFCVMGLEMLIKFLFFTVSVKHYGFPVLRSSLILLRKNAMFHIK